MELRIRGRKSRNIRGFVNYLCMSVDPVRGKVPSAGSTLDQGGALGRRVRVHVGTPSLWVETVPVNARPTRGAGGLQVTLGFATAGSHPEMKLYVEEICVRMYEQRLEVIQVYATTPNC